MYKKAEVELGLGLSIEENNLNVDLIPMILITRNVTLEVFTYYLLQNNCIGMNCLMRLSTVKRINEFCSDTIKSKSLSCLTSFDIRSIVHNIQGSRYSSGYKYVLTDSLKNILLAAYEQGLTERKLYDYPLHRPISEVDERGYSKEQMLKLNIAFEHSIYGNFFKVIESTGLTKGEALSLTRRQYIKDDNKLEINSEIINSTRRGMSKKELTDSRNRVITLPDVAAKAIEIEINKQEVHRMKAGICWNNTNDYIFTDSDGNVLRRKSIETETYRIRKETGIESFCTLKLRENYIIAQIESGVHLKALADYLGYASLRPLLKYIPQERRHLYNV